VSSNALPADGGIDVSQMGVVWRSWFLVAVAALVWAALRFGPQGATLAVAVAVVEAVVLTANERAPFVVHAVNDTALNLQLYIIVAALITQCLTVIVSERRRGALELAESRIRIATAAAAERRRLRDESHGSAQNRLVGLLIRLRLAQEDVAGVRSRMLPSAPGATPRSP
jgi:hypothetical protein